MEKVLDLAVSLVVFAGVVSAGALMAGWLYDRVAADDPLPPHGAKARRLSLRERWSGSMRWWVGG